MRNACEVHKEVYEVLNTQQHGPRGEGTITSISQS